MRTKKRTLAISVLALAMTVGAVSVAAAQAGDDGPAKAATETTLQDFEIPVSVDHGEEDEFFGDEWELSEEEIAEINAETDALVKYLEDLGFEVTVGTDELGLRYVEFDESIDEAVSEAMDDFYEGLFAEEVAGWSDEEKAAWNAEVDALVAELAAEGVTVETEEIAPGVYDIVWSEELEEILEDLEDEYCDPSAEADFEEFDEADEPEVEIEA